ncbi:MAG: choice-of-anchor B family protein [Acidobacteriota bacterium]
MMFRRSFWVITPLLILCATTLTYADFGHGANVNKLANFNFEGGAPYSDVYYSNGRAFIGGYRDGRIHIVDVRDDNNIRLLGVYQPSFPAGILDLQARGDLLFAALSRRGFTIVDISNPAKPKEIAHYEDDLPNGVHDLFVTDRYVYLCDNGKSLLHIIDISEVRNPKLAGTFKSNGYTHDLTIVGNIGYIANIRGGFRIVDLANPAKPVVMADHNYAGSFTHNIWPTEDGKYVFTTDETCGEGHLRAFDISDLKNIRQVGEYSVNKNEDAVIHNAMVVGNYAYISYYRYGLRIVDISDPKNLKEVAFYDTWNEKPVFNSRCFEGAWGVYAQENGRVYISDISTGLWVFQFPLVNDSAPSATFSFPRGNEVFGQGQQIQVEWTAKDDRGIVEQQLEISLDGGSTYTPLASQLSGDIRSFAVKLPSVTAEQARLRLSVRDSSNPLVAIESGIFKIVADASPTIQVIFPNGGEVFSPGQALTVQWKSADDRKLSAQSVELSLDGGTNFTTIGQLNGELQQLVVNLPGVTTDKAIIRITVTDSINAPVSDLSDRVFRISDDKLPTVRLKSPNGGEQFEAGQQIRVDWTSSDDRGLRSQSLALSTDAGATFTELVRLDGTTQSVLVNLPQVVSQNCRIRISVEDGIYDPVSSISEADFAIFTKLPRIVALALKPDKLDRLVIDLDPNGDHLPTRQISPLHEEGEDKAKIEIDSGSGFIAYSKPGKIAQNGTRLITKGKLVDGRTTRQAIPSGVPVKIRLTNSNGARAQVTVIRNGTTFSLQ